MKKNIYIGMNNIILG
jgi:hypothetical protein